MRIKSTGLALVCAAATLLAGQALAQTHPAAAPAAAAPTIPTGPAIPGLCVLNREGLLYGSTVGKYVDQRLHQLKAQSDAELNAEATTIKSDVAALQAQKATLPPEQYEQQGAALNGRISAFQAKAQKRDAEMQRTLEKAVARINKEAEPYITQAFAQHNCSILFSADSVMFSAQSMDITQQVVVALNAKFTQFPFDREQLPDQQGAAPAQ
jgi:Skp family chaperone for outer membrane proteins